MTVGYAWKKSRELYAELPFTASISGKSFTYSEADSVISKISTFLLNNNFKQYNKAVILSENRSEWGLCWMAITTIGGIAVPVMIDFAPQQILNILEHSEASFVFVSEKLMPKIAESNLVKAGSYVIIDDSPLFEPVNDITEKETQVLDDMEKKCSPEDTVALIYTSGTTGTSKGVLLSHKNIMTNACDSVPVGKFAPGDSMLSVLPLAHMYEFTQGFMLPMIQGGNITYLGLKPSPSIMLKAISQIRPHYILSVPLLIEKIYKNSVLGPISKSSVLSRLYNIKIFRKLLNRFVIGKKLLKTFGGRLKFFGIGGAPLSETVEIFLREARFPYAVGYGLTETSPVLAGSGSFETVFRGIGKPFNSVKLRISEEGEIQAFGDTVMQGYYKDEERTNEVFTGDGWFKTGDLGRIDENGNLFINGRLKNLILGPGGENIYPEEIENELKSYPLVSECIVLEDDVGLIARVFVDEEKLKQHMLELIPNFDDLKNNISAFTKEKEKILENLRQSLNQKLTHFSKLHRIVEQEEPFELTPSLKVKRFLYSLGKKEIKEGPGVQDDKN